MNYTKLLFSRVASPFGEAVNVDVRKPEVRKRKCGTEVRKYGSKKVGSQTLPLWVGGPAHTGKVWEACPCLVLSWFTRLAKG